MGRVLNVMLLAAMIVGAVVTYHLKRGAEIATSEVASLRMSIAEEKEALALLKAEWSMLTQPGRLQSVVEEHDEHFQLRPFSPEQIGSIDEIPLRPGGSIEVDRDALARLAAGITLE